MKINHNKKLLITVVALFLIVFASSNVQAATINVEAATGGYQRGKLAESPVIKELQDEALHDFDELDDYADTPEQSISDPFEPWNRFWFGFNDIFYLYVAKPLYTGYDFIMPEPVQSGLSNFFHNLLFPVRFVSSLLQGRPLAAGAEFGKFLINTTVGMGGFIDVAKDKKTIVPLDPTGESMDQTFGVWGIGSGPYLVWPIIGPSSFRGTVGTVADFFLDPTLYFQTPLAVTLGAGGLRFNDLGPSLDLYADTKELAIDPYIAMREAYAAFKKNQIVR